MKMHKAVAAALGAAVLAAGAAGGVAHAEFDGDTTGTVAHAATATAGANHAKVDATINASSGMKNHFVAKNGNENSSNVASNHTGTQRFKIG
jgi:hypothetical protein